MSHLDYYFYLGNVEVIYVVRLCFNLDFYTFTNGFLRYNKINFNILQARRNRRCTRNDLMSPSYTNLFKFIKDNIGSMLFILMTFLNTILWMFYILINRYGVIK